MFHEIVHADWSIAPGKRWLSHATREGSRWRVSRPRPVGTSAAFLTGLLAASRNRSVLAGFDFPIGLPLAYAERTGFSNFREALAGFGTAPGWENVYAVADTAAEITPRRPFFPRSAARGTRRAALVEGLGLRSYEDLLRLCERPATGRRAPCALFWTLGPNQVGRAAIAGWREVVLLALVAGAALWPFDGPLETLAASPGLVLVETYPGDAYAQLGAAFGPHASKRRQADRRARAPALLQWAETAAVDLTACAADLRDGFGARASGEDAFDALLGALAMIDVAMGRRAALPNDLPEACTTWEGWILGR